jgi:hypothetical protein
MAAKSVYIENQTGDAAVLETAKKEFSDWKRFAIVDSENDADLTIVFRHTFGMDLIGNVSFIVMDVFVRGSDSSAFQSKSAQKVIWEPQRRTNLRR